MQKLEAKFRVELKDDAEVLACRFPLPNWKPTKVIEEGIDSVWLYQKKYTHNYWRYLSMVYRCSKASFHSCAIFGSILYDTVIWILWSKQSQFPLVIYDHSNHKLKSCGLSAYVASVSVWFWSKKRGTRVKDHPISFLGSCSIFHTAKIKNLALLRNHMETLATQASGLRALFYTCNTWIQSLTILKCHNRLGRFRMYPCAKLQQCGYPV